MCFSGQMTAWIKQELTWIEKPTRVQYPTGTDVMQGRYWFCVPGEVYKRMGGCVEVREEEYIRERIYGWALRQQCPI